MTDDDSSTEQTEEPHPLGVAFTIILLLLVMFMAIHFAIVGGIVQESKTTYTIDGQTETLDNPSQATVVQYNELSEKTQDQFRESAVNGREIQNSDALQGATYIKLDGVYYSLDSELSPTIASIIRNALSIILSVLVSITVFISAIALTIELLQKHDTLKQNREFQISTLLAVLGAAIFLYFHKLKEAPRLLIFKETNHEPTVNATSLTSAENNQLMRGITNGHLEKPTILTQYIGEYIQTNGEVYHITIVNGLSKFASQDIIWFGEAVVMSYPIFLIVYLITGSILLKYSE